MSYTVYFLGERDTPLSDAEREALIAHELTWCREFSAGATPYGLSSGEGGRRLSGSIQPSLEPAEAEEDVATLIAAIGELGRRLRGFRFVVLDDADVCLFETPPAPAPEAPGAIRVIRRRAGQRP